MPEEPFRLTVRAVICDGHRRCLLVRRSETCGRFVGTWEWPGGKVEPGEAFDTALLREVREETGLEIAIDGVAGAYGLDLDGQPVPVLCMEARPIGGELRLSDEHDDSVWAPLGELPEWELTDGSRQFVERYIENIQRITEGD